MGVFRVPNDWRNDGGKLTKDIETEEFKAALAYVKQLWEAGLFHPDSLSQSVQQTKDGFAGGKFGAYLDGWTALPGQRDTLRNPDPQKTASILVPPGHDGGKAVTDNSQGFFGFAAIPAKLGKEEARIKELLRVCDYCCAPFGSEEATFVRYGLPGVHHDLKDGIPVLTDAGKSEIGALSNIARRNDVFFYPNHPEDARLMQGLCRDQMAIGVDNPVISVVSPTYVAKAGELNQLRIDRLIAIVSGRQPFSALEQYVQEWRSRGGDQMRKEYQDALKGA
jgi:putative aldouronate transport system substrate-binding protein